MPFPKTCKEMIDAGFRRDNYARCRGCSAGIEWWISPDEKRIPMDHMKYLDSPAVNHFVTCPARELFHTKEDNPQGSLFGDDADEINVANSKRRHRRGDNDPPAGYGAP
jgi:hypothetical protein